MKNIPLSRKLEAATGTHAGGQMLRHPAEVNGRKFSENYGRFVEDDRSWDIAFWQRQGAEAIFDATWGMIKDHRLLTQNDATEPRLQRSVEYFGKA